MSGVRPPQRSRGKADTRRGFHRAYWRSDGPESVRVDLLGVSDGLGTIQIGKLADLVIWDGFDLDVSDRRPRIYTVIEDGEVVAGRFSNSIQFPSAP